MKQHLSATWFREKVRSESFRTCMVLLLLLARPLTAALFGQQVQHISLPEEESSFLIGRHFDLSDGLPSPEVHCLYQCSRGFLWIGTDAGLVRYDGKDLVTYGIEDGLTDRVIFKIREGPRQRLWLMPFNRRLAAFDPITLQVEEFPLLEKAREVSSSGVLPSFMDFIVDKSGTVWAFVDARQGFDFNLPPETILMEYRPNAETHIHALPAGQLIYEKRDGAAIAAVNRLVLHEEPNTKRATSQTLSSGLSINPGSLMPSRWRASDDVKHCELSDRSTLIAHEKRLMKIDAEGEIIQVLDFDQEVLALAQDASNAVWVGLDRGLGLVRLSQDLMGVERRYLENLSVSAVLCDDQRTLWAGTLESGVFAAFYTDLQVTDKGKSEIREFSLLKVLNDSAYVIDAQKDLFKLHKQKGSFGLKHLFSSDKRISDVLQTSDGTHFTLLGSKLWRMKRKRGVLEPDALMLPSYNGIRPKASGTQNDDVISYGPAGFAHFDLDSGKQIFGSIRKKQFAERIISVAEVSTDSFLLGGLAALYSYSKGKIHHFDDYPYLSSRINHIAPTDSGSWLATTSFGLVYFSGSSTLKLGRNEGLSQSVVSHICLAKDTIWALTPNALNMVTKLNGDWTIRHIQLKRYLPKGEIKELAWLDNKLCFLGQTWIATVAPQKLLKSENNLHFYFRRVRVGDTDTSILRNYALDYDENDVLVSYRGIDLTSKSDITYKYRLMGLDTNWRSTENEELQFLNLDWGEYELQLSLAGNNPGAHIAGTMAFTVAKHFTETWWFICSIVLTTLALAWYYLQNFRQRLLFQKKMLSSEQKALRAQMNPHFIFNAMNSIQYLIGKEDTNGAQYYLARFSKLVRFVLDNSHLAFVSLEDEIESLRLYLEMEKLRFEDRMTYNIQIDPNIEDIDLIGVPTMLLQPLVENSVVHGIFPKDGQGHIDIAFTLLDAESIKVSISDNGIGRQASMELQAKKGRKTPSVSGTNIKERIGLYARRTKKRISLKMDDRINPDGSAGGTIVTLIIPLQGID